MSPTAVPTTDRVTARLLQPMLGSAVVVRTRTHLLRGTLLSCVKGSAWLVVDDTDVMLTLDQIAWVRAQ
jgi:hypothetical protein